MIVLTADVHGTVYFKSIENSTILKNLTESDYFIVCGDFGVIWDESKIENELLKWFDSQAFLTLFIDGNHENFTLLNRYPVTKWKGGKIHKVSKKIIHLMRGQVFEIDEKKIFTFGGAFSIKKVIGNSPVYMWEEELPSQNEYDEGLNNLKIKGFTVDYVLTHTAPKKWLNEIDELSNEYERELNEYLDLVEEKTQYRHWYFGHFHKDINKEKYTVLYKKMLFLNGDSYESI